MCHESSTLNFMLNHLYNLYNRNQSKVEVVVRRAIRCALVLYLSIHRVGDLGEFGQLLCTQAWCLGMEKQVNIFPFPWLRGRCQVVTALSIPCNPPRSSGVQESKLSHEDAGRLVLSGLPTYLTPSSSSNHICCMIINYSLQGYIKTCLLHLGIFFYSLFFF